MRGAGQKPRGKGLGSGRLGRTNKSKLKKTGKWRPPLQPAAHAVLCVYNRKGELIFAE